MSHRNNKNNLFCIYLLKHSLFDTILCREKSVENLNPIHVLIKQYIYYYVDNGQTKS